MLLEGWGCLPLLARSLEDAIALLARTDGALDSIVADYSLVHGGIDLDAIDAVRRSLDRRLPGIVITGELVPEVVARINPGLRARTGA